MSDHYDVIVIGNGAGGGTLVQDIPVAGRAHQAGTCRVGDHLLERLGDARAGREVQHVE
jgi:choline dehydrogenase-like flavoprotein